MAFALLMMVVAGLFIGATASLMNNRAMQTSYLELAMKRRIALENSKAFSQEFMLERGFNVGSTVSSNQHGVFNNDWGGMDTSAGWTNLRVFASTSLPGTLTTVYPYNYTGLRPSGSYLDTQRTVRPPALTDVDPFTAYSFLKSYTPGLGGDPLIIYRKPTAAPDQIEIADKGNNLSLTVNGRTVVRDPDSFFAPSTANPYELPIRTKSLYIQKHTTTRKLFCKDLSTPTAKDLAPSNLPAARSTGGPTPETVTAADMFDGSLNVINNPSNPDNSLWHFMDREKAAGTGDFVTVNSSASAGITTDPWYVVSYSTADRSNDPPYPPPAYPSGYGATYNVLYINLDHPNLTHMRIYGVMDQLVLVGQTGAAYANAATLPPVMITAVPNGLSPNSLINLQCVNENNRRIVLGVQDTNHATLDMYWVGASASTTLIRWRMMLINEYRTIWANLPSTVTKSVLITGGVMTNWSFKRRGVGNAARLTLAPDLTPEPAGAAGPKFSSLLPRDAWMETYFLPTPP
jgi:hypothetical protein